MPLRSPNLEAIGFTLEVILDVANPSFLHVDVERFPKDAESLRVLPFSLQLPSSLPGFL